MAGFKVKGREYEFPTAFRVCDPVLIREVTGMSFQEFGDSLDASTDDIDPVVLAGLVAVGIWQQFPTWKRAQVVSYVEQLGSDQFEVISDGAGPPEAEAVPLSTGETGSPESQDGSKVESESL